MGANAGDPPARCLSGLFGQDCQRAEVKTFEYTALDRRHRFIHRIRPKGLADDETRPARTFGSSDGFFQ